MVKPVVVVYAAVNIVVVTGLGVDDVDVVGEAFVDWDEVEKRVEDEVEIGVELVVDVVEDVWRAVDELVEGFWSVLDEVEDGVETVVDEVVDCFETVVDEDGNVDEDAGDVDETILEDVEGDIDTDEEPEDDVAVIDGNSVIAGGNASIHFPL